MGIPYRDSILIDDWHVIADRASIAATSRFSTRLIGVGLDLAAGEGAPVVTRTDTGARLPVIERYGFVWTCLGEPGRDVVEIPEAAEPDRHLVTGGSIAVKCSGLRAVENFLDMG